MKYIWILSILTSGLVFAGSSSNRYIPGQFLKNGSGIFAIPSVSTNDQLVGRATTDTLTNKTINAPDNTVTNVANASVASNAAIDFSKLASLTSAHLLVGSAGNVATDTAVTGDVSITNAGVTAYSGVVPINKGGSNNAALAVTNGGVVVTDGSKMVNTGAGTSLQVLVAGTPPVWTTQTVPTTTVNNSATCATAVGYYFRTTGITNAPAPGDTYTNNSQTFTVVKEQDSNKTLVATHAGNVSFSGTTLARTSGAGDASITFISSNQQVPVPLCAVSYPANTTLMTVMFSGGGGGGGGAASAASDAAAGAGGQGGAGCYKVFTNPTGSCYYGLGGGGNGGAAGNNNGNTGNFSIFGCNGTFYIAPSGAGGTGMAAGLGPAIALTGNQGAVAVDNACNILNLGSQGGDGFIFSGTVGRGGGGGSGPFGLGPSTEGVGNGAGLSTGVCGEGGGGGTVQNASSAAAGGNGAGGCALIQTFNQ